MTTATTLTTAVTTPALTWIAHPMVPAGNTERCRTLPLDGCLTRAFKSDAHAQPATSPLGARLSSKHLGTIPIAIGSLWLDVDAPRHEIPTDPWRADFAGRVARLQAAEPGWLTYDTRHGARLVRALAEPFELRNREDAAAWRASYLSECERLERDYGLGADRSCADWQRLFRLPGACRPDESSPSHSPQRRSEAAPAPEQPWQPDPDDQDAQLGAFGSQLGRFFEVLLEQGSIRRELPRDGGARTFWVRCPHESSHSIPSAVGDCVLHCRGDGSLGWLACKHQSCAGREQKGFLRAAKGNARKASETASLRSASRSVVVPVAREGAESIRQLNDTPLDQLTDEQLVALRTGGSDGYSKLKGDALLEASDPDLVARLDGHPYRDAALRWALRGLSPELAVRWGAAMATAYPR